jgi:hypothetical protein
MAQQEWYVDVQGKAHGPYSSSQLRHFATSGQLQPTTNVMLGGQGSWMPAARITGLFAATEQPPSPPPAIAVPAATYPSAQPPSSVGVTKSGTGDVIGMPVLACGLVGSALLIVGVFTPIIQAPFVGSINYFTAAKIEACTVLAVGVLTAVAALLKITWPLVIGGLASLGLLTYQFTNLNLAMANAKASVKDDLADNPFAGLAEAFTEAMGIQWGFAVLVLGSLALVVAPMLREFRKPKDRTNTIVSGLVLAMVVILSVAGITYLSYGKELPQLAEGKSGESKASRPSRIGFFGSGRATDKKKDEAPNPVTIGETIQLGNLKITPKTAVKRPITVSTSSFRDETKKLDGPFLVITAEVENTSEGQVFNPFALAKGVDNFGNDFKEYDSAFNSVRDPDTWYGDLKPGERATVTMVLEPKNANAKWYRITVSQSVDNQKTYEKWSILLNNE